MKSKLLMMATAISLTTISAYGANESNNTSLYENKTCNSPKPRIFASRFLNNRDPELVKELTDMLQNDLTGNNLSLSGSEISDDVAKIVAHNLETKQSIKSLDLGFSFISTIGINEILKALRNNSTLTSLNLNRISSDNGVAIELCTLLTYNSTITSINFSYNSISTSTLNELLKAMESQYTLTSLNLDRIEIYIEGEQRHIRSKPSSRIGMFYKTAQ